MQRNSSVIDLSAGSEKIDSSLFLYEKGLPVGRTCATREDGGRTGDTSVTSPVAGEVSRTAEAVRERSASESRACQGAVGVGSPTR